MSTTPVTSLPFAVGIGRVSTENQHDSAIAQAEALLRGAAYRNHQMTAADVFVDENVSGDDAFMTRPQATAALVHAAAIGAKILYFTKVDRAFRNMLDAEFTVEELGRRGYRLYFLDFFGQELDLATAMGRMTFQLAVMVAQFERKRRSERVKETGASKRANGHSICGECYGWDRIPNTTGRLTKNTVGEQGAARVAKFGDAAFNEVPNAFEQRILARILSGDLSAQSCSANEAARRLNAAGIPAKKGGKWYAATVEKLRKTGRLAQAADQSQAA